jgi:hypothetical protein
VHESSDELSAMRELIRVTHRSLLLQILFFAITTAPMIATSNSREAISKANM